MTDAVRFKWIAGAEVMQPVPAYLPLARRQYSDGEVYRFVVEEERSQKSHDHYFVMLTFAWRSLPENFAPHGRIVATFDHFRQWALIEANYYTEEIIDCGTPEVAQRVSAFALRESEKKDRTYIEVILRDHILVIHRPMSQRYKAAKGGMDRETFQKSKDAVLEIACKAAGVTMKQLDEAARKHAHA